MKIERNADNNLVITFEVILTSFAFRIKKLKKNYGLYFSDDCSQGEKYWIYVSNYKSITNAIAGVKEYGLLMIKAINREIADTKLSENWE